MRENKKLARLSSFGLNFCLCLTFAIVPLAYTAGDPEFDDFYYLPKYFALFTLVKLCLFFALLATSLNAAKFWKWNKLDTLIVLFLFALICSTIFSARPIVSIFGAHRRSEGLLAFLAYTGLFLICAHCITTKKQICAIVFSLLTGASVAALYGIVQFLGVEILPRDNWRTDWWRSFATSGNPNFLSAYLLLAAPVALSIMLCGEMKKRWRIASAISFFIISCCIITTYTRAGYFGFAVGTIILLIILGYTLIRQNLLSLAILFFLLLCATLCIHFLSKRLHSESLTGRVETIFEAKSLQKDSGAVRLFIWRNSLPLISERPLFGWGLENFAYAFYHPGRKLDGQGFDGRLTTISDRAENTFLQIAVTTGIFGLSTFVLILIAFFATVHHSIPRIEDPLMRTILCGICAGWWGHLGQQFFSFSTLSSAPVFWGLGGLAIATVTISRSNRTEETPPANRVNATKSEIS